MKKLNETDGKQLAKDLKKITRRIEKLGPEITSKVLANQRNKYLSFDEVETVPYSAGAQGQLVLSGEYIANSDFSLEALLAQEKQDMEKDAIEQIIKSFGGVLK